MIDEYNVLTFIDDCPHRTQLKLVVGRLHSLLLRIVGSVEPANKKYITIASYSTNHPVMQQEYI